MHSQNFSIHRQFFPTGGQLLNDLAPATLPLAFGMLLPSVPTHVLALRPRPPDPPPLLPLLALLVLLIYCFFFSVSSSSAPPLFPLLVLLVLLILLLLHLHYFFFLVPHCSCSLFRFNFLLFVHSSSFILLLLPSSCSCLLPSIRLLIRCRLAHSVRSWKDQQFSPHFDPLPNVESFSPPTCR